MHASYDYIPWGSGKAAEGEGLKALAKIMCGTAVALTFATVQASEPYVLAWDVAGHGSPLDTTLSATTISIGVANIPTLSRVGVVGAAAANSFNQNNWNNTATFIENDYYITFTLTAGSLPLSPSSLQFAAFGSNTAPNQGRWGYSINGGAFTTFDFTIGNTAPSSLTTWNLGGFFLSAGESVEFRMWVFGTTSISGGTASSVGTVRLANLPGNDLILDLGIIPEPSTIALSGFGLVGLLAFARRRRS